MQTPEDYRAIHLERGGQYDNALSTVPFDAYMAAWEHSHVESLVKSLFPSGVGRYLDFACGTGRITSTVAPSCAESVGVDISPTMLETARRKLPSVTFKELDLTSGVPIELGAFDLATAFRFFGNAQDDLREPVLVALHQLLRPGGILIINSHRNPLAPYALLDRLSGNKSSGMDLHWGKLVQLLSRHGFLIKEVRPIGAWMYRSRLLNAFEPNDPIAVARELRFSMSWLARWAPDVVLAAERMPT